MNYEEKYELTVGLEVHAELKTKSKMFCGCANNPDEQEPNVNICPICIGHPGTLPVINKQAVKNVLKVGLAVGGKIADFTEFDRKHYFYPDIPKGYQISQYKYPLVSGGSILGVNLTRIHLEEDTAKSSHESGNFSLIDFNRSGLPLMELVTEPDIKSAKQAGAFAKELQLLLRTLDVAEANMEKGEMRVEANISVAKKHGKRGTKVEVKNLNSFKAVERSIEYEFNRQVEILEKGEVVVQETRGFDESTGTTFSQRKKEDSHDYRYFPDPDLPKMYISRFREFEESILRSEIRELPWQKRDRLIKDFELKSEDIEVFVSDYVLGNFMDSLILELKNDRKLVTLSSNYLCSDVIGMSRKNNMNVSEILKNIGVSNFASLIRMISQGKVSSRGAKDILSDMVITGSDPEEIASSKKLFQVNDEAVVNKVIESVILENPKVLEEYKLGKKASLQYLVGQAMKKSGGSLNPATLSSKFEEFISLK